MPTQHWETLAPSGPVGLHRSVPGTQEALCPAQKLSSDQEAEGPGSRFLSLSKPRPVRAQDVRSPSALNTKLSVPALSVPSWGRAGKDRRAAIYLG